MRSLLLFILTLHFAPMAGASEQPIFHKNDRFFSNANIFYKKPTIKLRRGRFYPYSTELNALIENGYTDPAILKTLENTDGYRHYFAFLHSFAHFEAQKQPLLQSARDFIQQKEACAAKGTHTITVLDIADYDTIVDALMEQVLEDEIDIKKIKAAVKKHFYAAKYVKYCIQWGFGTAAYFAPVRYAWIEGQTALHDRDNHNRLWAAYNRLTRLATIVPYLPDNVVLRLTDLENQLRAALGITPPGTAPGHQDPEAFLTGQIDGVAAHRFAFTFPFYQK